MLSHFGRQALASYLPRPRTSPSDPGLSTAEWSALAAKVAAEIAALPGAEADPRIASFAANHFLTYSDQPHFGLSPSAHSDPLLAMKAAFALDRWLEHRGAEWKARQSEAA